LSQISGAQPELGQGPVVRRPGSKRESEELSELAQSVGARGSGPIGDDTSLSDLAAATGIRRNTAPTEIPSSAQPRSSAQVDGWEQSAHDYPVLIPGPDANYKSRMRWPLVVLLLLALVATAGYFLGFQKWITSAKPQTPQASNPIRKETEAPAASVTSAPPDPAVKPPETAAVVKPPETAPGPVAKPETQATEVPAPGTVDGAQARYSLQAASFPKEVQAKEFSDKLVRAGVPAYIMSIDIPRRGKWFRVRVGRFPSADEAGKYASQARQRARAAGINLELIVCDFERT
jgi:cell division septation protein DedD